MGGNSNSNFSLSTATSLRNLVFCLGVSLYSLLGLALKDDCLLVWMQLMFLSLVLLGGLFYYCESPRFRPVPGGATWKTVGNGPNSIENSSGLNKLLVGLLGGFPDRSLLALRFWQLLSSLVFLGAAT